MACRASCADDPDAFLINSVGVDVCYHQHGDRANNADRVISLLTVDNAVEHNGT